MLFRREFHICWPQSASRSCHIYQVYVIYQECLFHQFCLINSRRFVRTRVLRRNSDGGLKLEHSNIEDSFQFNAAKVFNNLPEHLKLMDFKNYKIAFKSILLDRARLLEKGLNHIELVFCTLNLFLLINYHVYSLFVF